MIERYDKNNPKVIVTEQDIQIIDDLFTSFKIPMSPKLKAELSKFRSSPETYTIKDQEKLRAYLAHSIVYTDHDLFNSEIFTTNIKDKCEKEWFEAQFYLDLGAELGET